MFLFFCNNWDRKRLVPGQLRADVELLENMTCSCFFAIIGTAMDLSRDN
jgi:hypothetical protein